MKENLVIDKLLIQHKILLIMKNQVHKNKLFGPIYNYDVMKWANAA